jgi:cytochrome b
MTEKSRRATVESLPQLRSHAVWDLPTRWLHWTMVLAFLPLTGSGLILWYYEVLELPRVGKVMIEDLHVIPGYILAAAVLARIVWGFVGNRHARWREMLTFSPSFLTAFWNHVADFVARRPYRYLGHNPLGSVAVVLMMTLMTVLAVTGLILSEFGAVYVQVREWLSALGLGGPNVSSTLASPDGEQLRLELRALRWQVLSVHRYAFFALAAVVVVHVVAVVATEVREGGALISAMITGHKVLDGDPLDAALPTATDTGVER